MPSPRPTCDASLPVITYQNPLTRDPSQSFPGTPGSGPGDCQLPQGFTQDRALRCPAQARWRPGRTPTCSPRSRIRSPGRLHRQPSSCWCSVYCSRRSWKTTRMMLWQGNRQGELSVGTKRYPPPAFTLLVKAPPPSRSPLLEPSGPPGAPHSRHRVPAT